MVRFIGKLRPIATSHRRDQQRGVADAHRLADQLDQLIEAATRDRLLKLALQLQSVPDSWEYQACQDFGFLNQIAKYRAAIKHVRRAFASAATQQASDSKLLRFCMSTAFLRHECFPYLTGDEQRREVLHLVTGPITADGVRVPSRIEKVAMQEQSAAYAAAEPLATHKQMVELEREGHALLACFHSHIAHGQESTRPSQIDIDTQDRFAFVGWEAIGGIFNLDGWVRLFSTSHDFTVELYGNGAEIVSAAPRETVLKLAIEP
jgi:hypothetical protein